MSRRSLSILLVCLTITGWNTVYARQKDSLTLATRTGNIEGTLFVPNINKPMPVVLIIAGSGPTDRDGNNPMMKNNSLKMLADSLVKHGIASFRYDKRGVAASASPNLEEKDLRFEDYIRDAADWVSLLKADQRFSKVIVLGHSEGSLIGMIASDSARSAAFISIAGPGQSADKTLKEQLKAQPQAVADMCYPIIDSLAKGKTVADVDPMLNSLFRPDVQPYMISWFRYDPQAAIKKLTIPILIVQGTTDLQVSTTDAALLYNANTKAQQAIINNMNHILKQSVADRQTNIQTYNNPELPLAPELITNIVTFIKSL